MAPTMQRIGLCVLTQSTSVMNLHRLHRFGGCKSSGESYNLRFELNITYYADSGCGCV